MKPLDLLIFAAICIALAAIAVVAALSLSRWLLEWRGVWRLRAKNRPYLEARRHTRVLFTASDREVERMAVDRGPCHPLPGRKAPLAGRFAQQWPSLPAEIEGLWDAIRGDSTSSAWSGQRKQAPGHLYTLSEPFTAALVRIDEARRRSATDDERHEILASVAAGWRLRLPPGDRRDPLWHRLEVSSAAELAGRAARKGQRVHCWFGPGVDVWSQARLDRTVRRFRTD
jgi:hypothetical protein